MIIISRIYLYCWWIFLWTILFLLNIIKVNPFFSSLIGTTVSYYIHFVGKDKDKFNTELKTFIITVELLILFVLFLKFNIKNIKLDILFNILIFSIYLCVLFINNKSFYQIYFVDLVKQKKNIHNFTMKKYIQKRLSIFF